MPTSIKKEFINVDEIPNMLFVGDAGVGKTTIAKILCNTKNVDWMFLNASTERGIDEVRTKVQQFASTSPLFGGGYKVLILDESDNLTPDAQKALRALIEEHQNNCRFLLTANYPYKLIDPLRSRLQEYVFSFPVDGKELKKEFLMRMLNIIKTERVVVKKEDFQSLQMLVDMYYPNWRRVIHQLQRCCSGGEFDSSVVTQLQGEHISTLFDLMKSKNFTKMRNWVAESLSSGVSSTEVIDTIYKELKLHVKPQSLPPAILVLAEYQHKAAVVSNQEINTTAMCVELMMNAEWL